MSATKLSSSTTPIAFRSLPRSINAIAHLVTLASLSWGVTSIPLNPVQAAQFLPTTARIEESEKCEWLGVCDDSEVSNHVARTEESDQCRWLGVCD